ncbi:hypothetical protein B0T26DRAFT_677083 [Lasiosphaeria miniovina]|uniref:Uncharacterized protein n=1 Tax=Lasiosphaeria miniovina TaxID=1954250 RepID=A0AA40AB44_9PEZI|nr:uncharacterized protein B0T26DRAFT_677083 [Lasiosphaeria miniovina]KAK0712650.1 hypothetical protein B0T26DRAFT_677083 [Lasiosphaeria miniovina]
MTLTLALARALGEPPDTVVLRLYCPHKTQVKDDQAVAVASLTVSQILAYETTLGLNSTLAAENRTLDEIYQAALAEGGTVTLWHGGDEANQIDGGPGPSNNRYNGLTH